jgi:hypothetical protein
VRLDGVVWRPEDVSLRLDQLGGGRAVLRVAVGDLGDGTVVALFEDRKRGVCTCCTRERLHVFVPVARPRVEPMCGNCWLRTVLVRGFVGEFR